MSSHQIKVFQSEQIEVINEWVPSHGLERAREALAKGKEVVFVGACNCGCWKRNIHSKLAVEMIKKEGLEGKVYHNLIALRPGPVVIYPEELRPDEYHVADNLPWEL